MGRLTNEEISKAINEYYTYMPCPKCGCDERDYNEDLQAYADCSDCGITVHTDIYDKQKRKNETPIEDLWIISDMT